MRVVVASLKWCPISERTGYSGSAGGGLWVEKEARRGGVTEDNEERTKLLGL